MSSRRWTNLVAQCLVQGTESLLPCNDAVMQNALMTSIIVGLTQRLHHCAFGLGMREILMSAVSPLIAIGVRAQQMGCCLTVGCVRHCCWSGPEGDEHRGSGLLHGMWPLMMSRRRPRFDERWSTVTEALIGKVATSV